MTFQITIQPGGYRFPIENNDTILDAALRHGYALPYSCREGVCGICKGKVMEGQVNHGNYLGSTLADMDKAAGMTLFCCARPESDLIVECHTASVINNIPVRTMPCRVNKMTRLSEEVMALQLVLPMEERLHFLAGQHIAILPKDQKPRHFSLANPPHSNEFLELHIRRFENGAFTQYVFNELKERDILRLKGPLGGLQLRENSGRPIIFIADGTGFAPVRAMIEHALYLGLQRPMHFYWGGEKLADLYLLEKVKQWEDSGVKFTPVLSDALSEDGWQGRAGLVHQAVRNDFADLSSYEVYACGSPAMVEAAHRDLVAHCGLPEGAFLSSAFAPTPEFTSTFQAYRSPF